MNTNANAPQTIQPSFVVQEEGAHKVFVYLDIPELKVKRSFPNVLKFIPTNGHVKTVDFQKQAFTFTIDVQNRSYSLVIARLPGEIQPKRCAVKYKRAGCWIELLKVEPMSWMNRICDDLTPGLETREDDDDDQEEVLTPSAPPIEVQLKDTNMPPPFNLVPLAPSPPVRSVSKKAPAPPPPLAKS